MSVSTAITAMPWRGSERPSSGPGAGQARAREDQSREREVRGQDVSEREVDGAHQHRALHRDVSELGQREADSAPEQEPARAPLQSLAVRAKLPGNAAREQQEGNAAHHERLGDQHGTADDDAQESEYVEERR